jgi:hypothetical protein
MDQNNYFLSVITQQPSFMEEINYGKIPSVHTNFLDNKGIGSTSSLGNVIDNLLVVTRYLNFANGQIIQVHGPPYTLRLLEGL